jgi:hypothetical protein
LPSKVANASQEELQKMVMEVLRKLKAKDKKLSELGSKATNENSTATSADCCLDAQKAVLANVSGIGLRWAA